jgi:hypothetical protein|tara:strand:+ start:139 stop:630 length:492 start_codon:yes stop_codon:yes gene_type:complete
MADLGQEFRALAESFAHMIEGLAYLDEDEAGRLATKYSDELVIAVRSVYKDLANDMSAVLAKPPKKRRVRRKTVTINSVPAVSGNIPAPTPAQVANIRAEANIGVEEFPPQEETIRSQQVDPEDMGMALDNMQQSLHSKQVTKRTNKGGYQESRNPPQTRLDE